jgi:hypothetical protein
VHFGITMTLLAPCGKQVAQEPGASQFAHAIAHLAASVGRAQASERQIATAAALAELLAAQLLQVRSRTHFQTCNYTQGVCYQQALSLM